MPSDELFPCASLLVLAAEVLERDCTADGFFRERAAVFARAAEVGVELGKRAARVALSIEQQSTEAHARGLGLDRAGVLLLQRSIELYGLHVMFPAEEFAFASRKISAAVTPLFADGGGGTKQFPT